MPCRTITLINYIVVVRPDAFTIFLVTDNLPQGKSESFALDEALLALFVTGPAFCLRVTNFRLIPFTSAVSPHEPITCMTAASAVLQLSTVSADIRWEWITAGMVRSGLDCFGTWRCF